jgi:hypothetical protein
MRRRGPRGEPGAAGRSSKLAAAGGPRRARRRRLEGRQAGRQARLEALAAARARASWLTAGLQRQRLCMRSPLRAPPLPRPRPARPHLATSRLLVYSMSCSTWQSRVSLLTRLRAALSSRSSMSATCRRRAWQVRACVGGGRQVAPGAW